jgi:hypothetical protein
MENNFEPYPEALELAAKAGDAQSQWLISQIVKGKYSFYVKSQTSVEIWGADCYKTERTNLKAAARSRHPRAQMDFGALLFKGNVLEKPQRFLGACLWISGLIGRDFFELETLPKRLLKISKRNDDFHLDGTRTKFNYKNFSGANTGTCGVRIDYKSSTDCQIVLEHLPNLSVPSVTNAAAKIATNLLYHLLLSGVALEPEKIQWYEAYPIGSFYPGEDGTLISITFDWDGTTYDCRTGRGQPKQPVRIDLSDILRVSVYG